MEFSNKNYEPTVSDAIVTVSAHAAAMIEEAKRITGNALVCKDAQDCRELLRYASEYTKNDPMPFEPSDYGFETENELIIGMMVYLTEKKISK